MLYRKRKIPKLIEDWMIILMININKERLKKYFYHLCAILLFSYSFMMLTAEEMGIVEIEFKVYLGLVYLSASFGYHQRLALLKDGRKSIFYSLLVILIVFLMHYWFCIGHDCLYIKDVSSFFLTVYIVIAYELFDLIFYKAIIDDGKNKLVSRILKISVPKENSNNALLRFSEILEIDHLYLFGDLEKEKNIENLMDKREGWLFYKTQNQDEEFDYNIELNTYMEYTTLWSRLLKASKEGFKIYIEDKKNSSYDIIENGKVYTNG